MKLKKLLKNLHKNGPSAKAVSLIEANLTEVQDAIRKPYVPKAVTYSGLAFAEYAFAAHVRRFGFADVVERDSQHLWKLKDAQYSRGFKLETAESRDPDLADRELKSLLKPNLYDKYAVGELMMKEFVKEHPSFFAGILDIALDA